MTISIDRTCGCGCGVVLRSRRSHFAPGHNLRVAPRGAVGRVLPVLERQHCACGCGEPVAKAGQCFRLGHSGRPAWTAGRRSGHRIVTPRCRGCSKEPKRAQSARGAKSYDAETNTYLCHKCATPRLRLCCRRCGKVRDYQPAAARQRKSLEFVAGPGYDGTYLCKRCRAVEHGRAIQRNLLALHGVTSGDGPETRLQVRKEILSSALETAGGRPGVMEKAHEGARRGHSENARRRGSLRRMVTLRRQGRFCLCRLCHKLVYLEKAALDRGGFRALGFHAACSRRFRATPEYRRWQRQVGPTTSAAHAVRVRRFPRPLPPPPRGRPPTHEDLDRNFRWLLRHFAFGESWGQIAADTHYHRTMIQKSVVAFIELLPESWEELFRGRTRRWLAEALPVAQLRAALEVRRRAG